MLVTLLVMIMLPYHTVNSIDTEFLASLLPPEVNNPTTRQFNFHIEDRYAPLVSPDVLPQQTSIYHRWPRKDLRTHLPDFLSIATYVEEGSSISDTSYVLMAQPIHVVEGNQIDLNIVNKLQATGLSIHSWI